MATDTRVTQVIAKVRELAKDRPNNKYLNKPCFYQKGECSDKTIGCIFGQVLKALGYEFVEDEPKNISNLMFTLGMDLGMKEYEWVSMVQQNQDFDKTWEESVRLADEYVEKRHGSKMAV
jgi:hypothetical protein